MGEHTRIEWTDHTFNPWIGCAKVSPGRLQWPLGPLHGSDHD